MVKLNLNGSWKLCEYPDGVSCDASVPSCNYTDLMKAGIIDDPFKGLNEKECLWVAQKDWLYSRTFDVDGELAKQDRVVLVCRQLDTLAEISVNGRHLASTDNCHMGFEFDIKDYIHEGINEIEVLFRSPANYVAKMKKDCGTPPNPNGLDGIDHIRKPQSHFGWDWGPVLPPSGITGDIFIEGRSVAHVVEFAVKQTHGEGSVRVDFAVDTEFFSDVPSVELKAELVFPDGSKLAAEKAALQKTEFCFSVESPELWWPNGMTDRAEQPLYECRVTLFVDGNEAECRCKKIGLRTLRLDRSSDEYGSNFKFVVNGRDVFCKGANLIPFDSFDVRTDRAKIEFYVKACVKANFNMLRIWGGGYYGSDDLYDLCDKYGIMLWQDFGFACMTYPFYEDKFLDNVHKEVVYNLKRLREHPCLAVWCGNNEIEAMSSLWVMYPKSMKWNEKFFYTILPEWVAETDGVTPYIPTSPCGSSHLKEVSSDAVGDTHLWAVWHGLQSLTYYRSRNTRFCSEFGFESLPDKKTIEFFASPSDYDLSSPVFNAHQKCASGNKKMIYYIASRFRLPAAFEDYVYLSQICQSECVSDATEHWRRNKGRCNGSLYWQLNDCWPVCSWASMDYFGNYKCLQYRARHFFAPVAVSIADGKHGAEIYLLNDTIRPFDGSVKVEILRFDGGKVLSERMNARAEAGSSVKVFGVNYADLKLSRKQLEGCVMRAVLYSADGSKINVKTALFGKENGLSLPDCALDVKTTVADGKIKVEIKADKYARFVSLYSPCVSEFSDNFFDLMPGETVSVEAEADVGAEEFSRTLEVKHLAQIKHGTSKLREKLMRLRIFLIPVNFFSYLYYKTT